MLLDKLCHDAGVEVRFFTRVIDADADRHNGRVRGVITSSVEGYRCLRAAAFIDGTGDAILADLCGAQRVPPAATRLTSCRPRSAPW